MWPAEWVIERYAKSTWLRGKDFDRDTLLNCWQVSPNYASVSLHWMRKLLLVDRVGRARYSLVPPEKWINLSLFSAQRPEISGALYELLMDQVNHTESLFFYGSRARGVWDELSDWDFLIITSPKAKDQMLARLGSIKEKNPLFTPEILDLEGFKICLKKALVFLKAVSQEGKIIFDSGLMGLVKASQVKPVNIAYELLDAKKNILMGISLLKNGKNTLACYRVVKGVRLTLLADLASKGIFSGEDIEREFMHKFTEFVELREAYRMIKVGKKVEVDARKLGKLINNAILTWEETRERAGGMVGKGK
jgi:hypothetical protein